MSININANSATPVVTQSTGFDSAHDVIDPTNGKAYRQVFVSGNVALGDVVADFVTAQKASETNQEIRGVAIGNVTNGNYGFVQSFGFGQAKVATGTPANVFLVPSSAAGVLRAVDLSGPEAAEYVLRFLDQRPLQRTANLPNSNVVRLIVSLTAESGGLADVFIF